MTESKKLLLELLFGGFFAVACIRAHGPFNSVRLGDIFRLTGRLERLRRSRWQWFCMIGLLLLLREQMGQPILLEMIVALQFVTFLALPVHQQESAGALGRK